MSLAVAGGAAGVGIEGGATGGVAGAAPARSSARSTLPSRRAGQLLDHAQRGRDHGDRHEIGQPGEDVGRTGRVRGDDVGLQAGAGVAGDHDDGSVGDCGQGPEGGFDLPDLDPVAVDLDLVVEAARDLDLTVVAHPGAVTGPVPPPAVAEDAERGGGLRGTVDVPLSELGPREQELTPLPRRHRSLVGVGHQRPHRPDRTTDRQRAGAGVGAHRRREGDHGGLGGAVGVDEPRRGLQLVPLRRDLGPGRLATDDEGAEAVGRLADPGVHLGHELVPERSGDRDRRDLVGRDELHEATSRPQELVGPQHDRRPEGERDVDLLDRGVEGQRMELQHPIVGGQVVGLGRGAAVRRQRPMADHHALRRARRPRGVDDVRQRVGVGRAGGHPIAIATGTDRVGDGHDARTEVGGGGGGRHQDSRPTVGDDRVVADGRRGKIDRHIAGADSPGRIHRRDGLGRPVGIERDSIADADTRLVQCRGDGDDQLVELLAMDGRGRRVPSRRARPGPGCRG